MGTLELSNNAVYEVYALRYATRSARSGDHFHGHDMHDQSMPMDYFVWALVSGDTTVIVDSGFTREVAEKRGRDYLRDPTEGLKQLDIQPDVVDNVIVTHLHYDHVGNLSKFPRATFVVQDREMAFWTGRYAGRGHFKDIVEPDDILHLVRENFKGRLCFVDGQREVLPGISVHRVGGHSSGLQIIRVSTARGNVVLASDATHFYANIEQDAPFSVFTDLTEMYEGFDLVNRLADSPDHVVPGHDPEVMSRYSAPTPGLDGIAVRIA